MLDTILGKAEKEEAKQKEIAKASPNNSKRDQLVPIYMYCKNLWDKWLCAGDNTKQLPYKNPFTVESYFKNFLFIDSFYRNIYNLLPVNCHKFMDIIESLATNDTRDSKSLYSFIGDLAKECNCLFVAVPDYINLGTVDNDGKMHRTGLENMSKIFKCIPHNEMRKIETDNKFIVIYTHEPSKNQDDAKGFANDTINICDSEGNVTEEAKQLFGGISTPKDADGTTTPKELDNMTAGAYPVPSFAVAFSGHNNHIFKSVDVNMDNPIATEHSINVLSYIAQMGSGNGQSVAYQGQDVFPIFSNYAYQSTVTMMGNVQIQPLMYYQLMNIPMWKGAYMIFNVKHSITPGNMTTTFTGMKMSKNTIPFLDKWVYPVENVVPQPVATVASTTPTQTSETTAFGGESFTGTLNPEDTGGITINKTGAFKNLGQYVKFGGDLSQLPGVGSAIKAPGGKTYQWIIIHCTAGSDTNNTENAYKVHDYHITNNGWSGIGYNFLILRDGTVQVGRSLGHTGGHTKGRGNSIGISVTWCGGHGCQDTRTSQQRQAMHNLINKLKSTYGITNVVGHRNCIKENSKTHWQCEISCASGAKSCPNFDAPAEFGTNTGGAKG